MSEVFKTSHARIQLVLYDLCIGALPRNYNVLHTRSQAVVFDYEEFLA